MKLLLRTCLDEDSQQGDGTLTQQAARWIALLLGSPLFAAQCKLAGKAVQDRDSFVQLLDTLDHQGGVASLSTLGRSLNSPPSQLNALIDSAQRILNIDGFTILTRDRITDTIRLDRDLLCQQFDIT